MSELERYGTGSFQARDVAGWRRLMDRVSWPVDLYESQYRAFEAELKIAPLGPLSFRNNVIGPIVAERRAEHADKLGEQQFMLALHTRGRVIISHYEREAVLGPDDIALTDVTAAARLEFVEPTRTLGLMIPGSVLRTRIAEPESVCALPLSGTRGFARVLRELMLSLWDRIEEGPLMSAEFEAKAVRHLLDLLATCYATEHSVEAESASVAAARLVSVKQHIECNLRNSELSPASVAAACGISARYLRKLFAAEDDSVTQFIRRRRLEDAARELTGAAAPVRSVTEVAFMVGFNSAAHFSRAFRERFGVTPRECRRDGIAALCRLRH